jgi:hypothetical protein
MRGSAQARSWTIERITEAQVNMSEQLGSGLAVPLALLELQ